MGVPDDYPLPTKYNEAYHLFGDGVAVPVVRWLERASFDANCHWYSGYDSGVMLPPENVPQGVPQDVAAIRQQIRAFLDTLDESGKQNWQCKMGCLCLL